MKQTHIRRIAVLGMMAAVVFAGNYLRVTMLVAIAGRTSFTFANIFCCLAGLLLGPAGGAAAGVGSALYDLMNPVYAPEFWITLINKGLMGAAAGLAVRRCAAPGYGRCTAGAVLGCAVYYVLYFFKSFAYDGLLMGGLTAPVAAAALLEKVPASLFNAAVAILLSPPLCLALRRALDKARLKLTG